MTNPADGFIMYKLCAIALFAKYALPLAMNSEYGLVIVALVLATGAPAI